MPMAICDHQRMRLRRSGDYWRSGECLSTSSTVICLVRVWVNQIGSRVIEPRDENMRVADVLATAPTCLSSLPTSMSSEARLLDFVNKHGCLDRFAAYVSRCLAAAARFQKVLGQFES